MSRFAGEPVTENKPQLLMRCALPWSGIPHRQHELACGLAEYFDVLYLEPPTQAKGAARTELDYELAVGPEFGAGGFSGSRRGGGRMLAKCSRRPEHGLPA